MSSSFTRTSPLSFWFKYEPQCSYHPTKKNCIIISTDWEEQYSTLGIYEYNLITNELTALYRYSNASDRLRPEHHGQFVDIANNTLYLYGGNYNVSVSLDLNNNELQQQDNMNVMKGSYSVSENVPEHNDEVHILIQPNSIQHYVFQSKTKSLIQLDSCSPLNEEHIEYPHLLYIPFKQQLMIFGSRLNDRVWEYKHSKWNQSKLHMPYSIEDEDYAVLLGFTDVVFVFYFVENCNGGIYLLDLIQSEWFKSKTSVPQCLFQRITLVWKRCVWRVNDTAHFVNFQSKDHLIVCLHDLIPKQLIKSRRKYYQSLVMGFLREEENDCSDYYQIIPFVLKQIILSYFQLFS